MIIERLERAGRSTMTPLSENARVRPETFRSSISGGHTRWRCYGKFQVTGTICAATPGSAISVTRYLPHAMKSVQADDTSMRNTRKYAVTHWIFESAEEIKIRMRGVVIRPDRHLFAPSTTIAGILCLNRFRLLDLISGITSVAVGVVALAWDRVGRRGLYLRWQWRLDLLGRARKPLRSRLTY